MDRQARSQLRRLETKFKATTSQLFSALRRLITNPKTGKVSVARIIFLLGVLLNIIHAIRSLVQYYSYGGKGRWDKLEKKLSKQRVPIDRNYRRALSGGRSKYEPSGMRQHRFYMKNRHLLR